MRGKTVPGMPPRAVVRNPSARMEGRGINSLSTGDREPGKGMDTPNEDAPSDWIELRHFVYQLVSEGKMNTSAFNFLIRIYGKEKLRELYKQERDRRKAGKG